MLLFALDPAVHARLAGAFEAGEVEKRYLAIVRGWPEPAVTIDHALTRLDDDGGHGAGPPRAARAGLARLATAELPVRVDRYSTSRYALVELLPLSGRRHQLRRHLASPDHRRHDLRPGAPQPAVPRALALATAHRDR